MRKTVREYHEPDIPAYKNIETYRWKKLGIDLKIIYVWIVLLIAILLIPIPATQLFILIIAIPSLVILSGYCLVAVFYPDNKTISGFKRVSFSIGLSILMILPIIFYLDFSPWDLKLDPIIIFYIISSLILLQIIQYRRFMVSEEERFHPLSLPRINKKNIRVYFSEKSLFYQALSIFLTLTLITVIGTTIYLIEIPKTGEKFTEFYILGSNGIASDYPTDINEGNSEKVLIGISNHEYRNTTYIVELWLTNATFETSTNTSKINEMMKLDSFQVTLGHNETYLEPYDFTPIVANFNQLTFLLFKNESPPDSINGSERIGSSYRKLRLWITIRPAFELNP